MKNYTFMETEKFIYYTQQRYYQYEEEPQLRLVMSTEFSYSKPSDRNKIFSKGKPRGKLSYMFDQEIVFDLWCAMSEEEKDMVCEMNLTSSGSALNDEWTFPIGKRKKVKGEDYWQITAMPLTDKKDNVGYLYLTPKCNRRWGLNYDRIFKRNGLKKRRILWQDLYSVWDAKDKPGFFLGGTVNPNFNLNDIKKLQKGLVTQTELENYTDCQNSKFAKKYISTNSSKFGELLSKKQVMREEETPTITKDNKPVIKYINSFLKKKYDDLSTMLKADSAMSKWQERDYQNLLLEIFPFIFPHYTHFIREYGFKIDGSSAKKADRPDFLAATSTLSVDVIEIKTPYFRVFKSGLYRGNYVFDSEVQGLISQVEKYIYNLERNAKREEPKITAKFKKLTDFSCEKDESLHIRSPKAVVVIGRRPESKEQIRDFDIYKRRYQDIADFLTYDDILERTKNIMNHQMVPIKNVEDNDVKHTK